MTIFGVINFLIEKVAKLVETQNFCQNCFNHLILHQGSYSKFWTRWIFRKLKKFGHFRGVSNENLIVTPPGKDWKNEPFRVVHNIKKYHRKMCLVFLENLKNCHFLFVRIKMTSSSKIIILGLCTWSKQWSKIRILNWVTINPNFRKNYPRNFQKFWNNTILLLIFWGFNFSLIFRNRYNFIQHFHIWSQFKWLQFKVNKNLISR